MHFRYQAMFEKPAGIGYESLLFDVMCGEQVSSSNQRLMKHVNCAPFD